MRRTRRDRLKSPKDGSFETILIIFLIWELKRLNLMFETETGTSQRQGRDGRETDEAVSKPRDRRSCNPASNTLIYNTPCFMYVRFLEVQGTFVVRLIYSLGVYSSPNLYITFLLPIVWLLE